MRAIVDGLFDGMMRRGRSDSEPCHRPVGSATECGGLEEYLCVRTIDTTRHLAPGLPGRAVEFDRRQKELKEAEEISQGWYAETRPRFVPEPVGLIWSIENPEVLERSIEILVELWQEIGTDGFDEEQDGRLLETIYGNPVKSHLRQTLHDEYSMWLSSKWQRLRVIRRSDSILGKRSLFSF